MQSFLPDHLVTGYQSFLEKRLPGERQRFRQLAQSGQEPKTMVIACCDSRTAPETIFDTAPGEIFVVRNVANLVPPYEPDGEYHSTSAALEFAVHALKVEHVVILGHGGCGGIHAALSPSAEPLSPGDFIGKWMSLLDPVAKAVGSNELMTARERQAALERIAIRHSIANLRTFPAIKALEDEGKLSLHGAWVDIASGELWAMDPGSGDFQRTVEEG
ncbi:carbonic anhydrase [Aurantimonas sp. VKM B-3413]|uniref:carbonic anhydrase n=1 Tax=Aurantimonas sp. VKM B-3413 TaxID=2779401 RepID=UPI001E5DDD83|nr:carbonic anhydrase [Aurantimonas sp. VKM B-3413]MCB8840678.1 carbonic anhydrase [Aurantimonas sp. VKM B-3413]